ncbi:MAG: RecQ family ATP-dependent DNA helicase [Ruminococcus sp.]|jgi:ATP-dependent DNA helicase RecQ|nr:RecQ family ATP-dependent DNA helicase [Ruminococcus sp.]
MVTEEGLKRGLRKYYGYTEFREGQCEVIQNILKRRDTIAIMPTGAGKSVCFQLPAVVFKGLTLVISPLISLMRDQVNALCQNGIPAAFINSTNTPAEEYEAFRDIKAGLIKLIYVAPERLQTAGFFEFIKTVQIDFIAVDEAHCVSQWGHEFRPSYRFIPDFIESLPIRPTVAAFTATATEQVENHIISMLRLRNPFRCKNGFNRENLYFGVEEVRGGKRREMKLMNFLDNHAGKSGIVYCNAKKTVDSLCELLVANGYSATRYHAGMSDNDRSEAQDDFLFDRKTIIVATCAFGMGIDKSNVGFVLHYNMPRDIESYYQEAGRAGRDGTPADCVMFFSGQDFVTARFLINNSTIDSKLTPAEALESRKRAERRLFLMDKYVHSTGCLREYILNYFGDKTDYECDNCSGCVVESSENVSETAPKRVRTERRKEIGKEYAVDKTLFEKLKSLRKEIADEQKVPAFVVFSDAALVDMCKKMPANRAEFLGVVGVGEVKADRYGDEFLEIINGFERVEAVKREGRMSFGELEAVISESYKPVSEEVTISQIADGINVILAENSFGRIAAAALNSQLLADDFLDLDENNKKIPSEKGAEIGIRVENIVGKNGEPYLRTLFNETAQAAILKSLITAVRGKFFG